MIPESAVEDKWPLDSMSKINCHWEITPCQRIEPATPRLQIQCSIELMVRPFLTLNQNMFAKVEVANQRHCRAHNNLCLTLHKRTCAFVCEQACEQLTQEWIENSERTIEGGDLYIFITKRGTIHRVDKDSN